MQLPVGCAEAFDPGFVISNGLLLGREADRGVDGCAAWQTKQLLPPTHPLTKAGSWTKYHLAVTKQVPSS